MRSSTLRAALTAAGITAWAAALQAAEPAGADTELSEVTVTGSRGPSGGANNSGLGASAALASLNLRNLGGQRGLMPFDKIKVTMHPLKDGGPGGQFMSVLLPDGKQMGDPDGRPQAAAGDTPQQ